MWWNRARTQTHCTAGVGNASAAVSAVKAQGTLKWDLSVKSGEENFARFICMQLVRH